MGLGAGVFGHLSDSFLGRKGSLQVVCFLNALFGLLTALAPTYRVYVVLRLLTGFSTGSIGLCAFVLATEPIGPSRRGTAGMSSFYFFSGGIAALAGVAAMFQSSWRLLYVVTSLPSLVFVLAVMPFISESPRWYLVRRRVDDAMRVLRDIAATNGRRIPDGVTLKLDDEGDDVDGGKQIEESSPSSSGSILDVFRSRTTRARLVLSVLINLLCSVVYYGLSLNVVNLKTNLYVSVAVNSIAEMPAYLLTALLLDHFGRKPLGIGTMLLSGVFCIAGSLIAGVGAMRVVRMVCGVVGIFGMAATYNLLFIYTAELFPTVVRNAALGCTSQASQMGAILAPMVVVLGERVPFAVFGVSGIIGGLLVFYLPETMNKPLYDTMAGLEEGEKTPLKGCASAGAFRRHTDRSASGETNWIPTEGVRVLPCTSLLTGAAERKPDDHLLLKAALEELGVDGSGGEGLGSSARLAEDRRKAPVTSLGGGGEWSEVTRVWSGERMAWNICGVRWISVGQAAKVFNH
ncbi:Organic cation transporter-like protein [Triticum urartu]|uniref:H(+)/Pi cotransporter n=1 Tax=Triticum urartu TaxID=4572 RepID=M7ZVS2_TRIUA|nr:Organic cation transporter-like protein [Triticum urartu]